MYNYSTALLELNGQQVKKINRRTALVRYGTKEIRLVVSGFNDPAIRWRDNEELFLSASGTGSTLVMNRINRYQSRVRVYSERDVWLVSFPSVLDEHDLIRCTFKDNMVIYPNGVVLGAGKPPFYMRKLRADVIEYASDLMHLLQIGSLESKDDCAECMNPEYDPYGNHYKQHIIEGYYTKYTVKQAMNTAKGDIRVWMREAISMSTYDVNDTSMAKKAELVIRRYLLSKIKMV